MGDAEVEGAAHDRPLGLVRPVVAEVVPQPERQRPAAAARCARSGGTPSSRSGRPRPRSVTVCQPRVDRREGQVWGADGTGSGASSLGRRRPTATWPRSAPGPVRPNGWPGPAIGCRDRVERAHDDARATAVPRRPRRQPAAPAAPAARPAAERAAGRISAERAAGGRGRRDPRRRARCRSDVGLRSATDGEFRRTSWHMDFIYQLGGIGQADERDPVHVPQRGRATSSSPRPRCAWTGRSGWTRPIFGDDFAFLKRPWTRR